MASNYTCRVCLNASRQLASATTRREALRSTRQYTVFQSSQTRSLSTIQRRAQQTPTTTPQSSSSPSYAAPESAAPAVGATTQTNATASASASAELSDAPPLPDIATPSVAQLQAAMRVSAAGDSTTASLAKSLRKHAKGTTETYIAYGSTEAMFKSCSAQAHYDIPQAKEKGVEIPKGADGMEMGVPIKGSFWYEDLKLLPVFNTWAQISMLHMYILTVRFRMMDPKTAPIWHQHLTDHFFTAAEDRMIFQHRMHQRAHRTKYLKDLHQQWRGVIAAYDEGLIKGDATMAAAVWRNLFGGKEDVDPLDLVAVVAYLRREVKRVSDATHESVEHGGIEFGGNRAWDSDKRSVLIESQAMKGDA